MARDPPFAVGGLNGRGVLRCVAKSEVSPGVCEKRSRSRTHPRITFDIEVYLPFSISRVNLEGLVGTKARCARHVLVRKQRMSSYAQFMIVTIKIRQVSSSVVSRTARGNIGQRLD